MSKNISRQTARREAPGSSVRSAVDSFKISKRNRNTARHAAALIDGTHKPKPETLGPILAALAAFGGRITRIELPAQ